MIAFKVKMPLAGVAGQPIIDKETASKQFPEVFGAAVLVNLNV